MSTSNTAPGTPVTTTENTNPATPDTPAPQDPQTDDNGLEWMDRLANDSAAAPAEFLRIDDRTVYETAETARKGWSDIKTYNDTLKRENESLRLSLAQGGSDDLIPALTTSVRDVKSPAFQNALKNMIKREAQVVVQEKLQALAPTIGYANFNRAVEIASDSPNGDPNIRNFVRSPEFSKMAKTYPTLVNGIAEARFNSEYAEKQLPEMLVLAYIAAKDAKAKAGALPAESTSAPATPGSTIPAPQPIGKPGLPGGSDLKDMPWGSVNWSHQTG